MVNNNSQHLDRIFHALADPTRRAVLERLAAEENAGVEYTVSDLAAPFEMSLAAVSKHIRVLETAELVRRRVDGRTHYCRIDAAVMAQAHSWLSFYGRFWNERLDALERLVTIENPQPENKHDKE